MALTEYKRKRSFRKSPEPTGGKSKKIDLIFVVQKHAASRLHYDFRLELGGVLLSWAVPKGPSLNPADKRLAMHVEDHPYDYKDFEGNIPEGSYGAGTVIVWDRGTYEPVEEVSTKEEQEKILTRDYKKGSMKIRLHGEKLKGEYAIVKMKGREKNSWLLIKHRDSHVSDEDITEQDKSVISGKAIEDLASDSKTKTGKSKRETSSKTKVARKSARKTITPKTRRVFQKKDERKILLNSKHETQVHEITGHELKFTNLSKVYWPDEGYTKRDLLNYYDQVSPYMLPYMKDRPQTLNRFPNGIDGESFYQKDVTGKVPSWVEKYKYKSEGDKRQKHFMVCTDEASILYIASLGCIEMNPWSSRVQSPDHPDWCVIDLDPGKKNTFEHVIEVAQITKKVLDTLGLRSFPKTSGSTGLHIYIPLGAKYNYEESKEFARAVVKIVNTQALEFTTIERKVSDRKGKMYLDFLQNRPQATLAGPYSLRPKPSAPVSMPLDWSEVKKGLKIQNFTITNAIARLKETGDLFEGVLGPGIDMESSLKIINDAFDIAKGN